jgi:hypothetical protein
MTVFDRKFTELQDVPLKHKIGIYSRGSLVAEDDWVSKREVHSCTLTCVSDKGKIFKVSFETL